MEVEMADCDDIELRWVLQHCCPSGAAVEVENLGER
jgi:hypothetical protein